LSVLYHLADKRRKTTAKIKGQSEGGKTSGREGGTVPGKARKTLSQTLVVGGSREGYAIKKKPEKKEGGGNQEETLIAPDSQGPCFHEKRYQTSARTRCTNTHSQGKNEKVKGENKDVFPGPWVVLYISSPLSRNLPEVKTPGSRVKKN